MSVPPAEVDAGHFETQVGFDEPCDLPQGAAEFMRGIRRPVCGAIRLAAQFLNTAEQLDRFLPLLPENPDFG